MEVPQEHYYEHVQQLTKEPVHVRIVYTDHRFLVHAYGDTSGMTNGFCHVKGYNEAVQIWLKFEPEMRQEDSFMVWTQEHPRHAWAIVKLEKSARDKWVAKILKGFPLDVDDFEYLWEIAEYFETKIKDGAEPPFGEPTVFKQRIDAKRRRVQALPKDGVVNRMFSEFNGETGLFEKEYLNQFNGGGGK
jgi:hypothetical protein